MNQNTVVTTIDVHLNKGAIFEITDKNIIIKNVPLTGEIVQEYHDGFAYKPLEEITNVDVQNVPVTFLHPDNQVEVMSTNEVADNTFGFLRNPSLDKKHKDKLYADIVLFRSDRTKDLEKKLEKGEGVDVSIGFQFEKEEKSGSFLGKAFDYIQRNIKLDHLAILLDNFGRVHPGRAPFSKGYGIGADQKNLGNKKMSEDKFAQLSKDHAILEKDFGSLQKENDSLKSQVADSEEKIKVLESDMTAKDEKLKSVEDKLKVYTDAEQQAVDEMRADLTKKMPNMEKVFASADSDSIKEAHAEMLKNKANRIEGDEQNNVQNDVDQLNSMFRSTKKGGNE